VIHGPTKNVVDDPGAPVTVTVLGPIAAPLATLNVAVIVVGLTTVKAVGVTPAPLRTMPVVAAEKLVPVMVTGTVLFGNPEGG
jgi:hypothetical protein